MNYRQPTSESEVYVVTGANGFVGRSVCNVLCSAGKQVRALVRRQDTYLERLGVAIVVAESWEVDAWSNALDSATHVIHCAGDPIFGNGQTYYEINVGLTENLLVAIKKRAQGIRRLVFVSTVGVIDRTPTDLCFEPLHESTVVNPTSDYGRSKLLAEDAVRSSGIPYCIVRPTMVVGAEMRSNSHFAVFARAAISNSIFGRFKWPGQLSVVHVEDLAHALVLCAHHPEAEGKIFLCSGDVTSISTFFHFCRPEIWRLPMEWLVALVRRARKWLPFTLKILMLPALSGNDAQLRKLGWHPRRSLDESLREVIERERARLEPTLDPSGQTVITGAASGLGKAFLEMLSPLRKKILLIDKNGEALKQMRRDYPNCRILQADLSREEEVMAVVNSKEWRETHVAELYACAGVGIRGRVAELPTEVQVDVLKVNLVARLMLTCAALKDMLRRHCGRIVLISSSSAFQPLPYMTVYAASNVGTLFLGEGLAAEVADEGVDVLTVCPGGMKTNFQKAARVKQISGERLLSAEEVVRATIRALRHRRIIAIVSNRAIAMNVLARVLPRRHSLRLWHALMDKMR